MRKLVWLITVLLIVAGSAVLVSAQPQSEQEQTQQGPPRKPPPPDDPLGDGVFPPELIMQHQRELALTEDQKSFMRSEIQRTTTRFNELQWQLQDSMEALRETLKGTQVNEELALAQLGKVLEAEREIKTLHMGMAIRIKNKLTPEQQTKLQSMKAFTPRPGGPGMGPGPGPGMGPNRRPGGGPGGGGPGGPGPGAGQGRPGEPR
jgi:Spy/CpxP family protein refolding chaperone